MSGRLSREDASRWASGRHDATERTSDDAAVEAVEALIAVDCIQVDEHDQVSGYLFGFEHVIEARRRLRRRHVDPATAHVARSR